MSEQIEPSSNLTPEQVRALVEEAMKDQIEPSSKKVRGRNKSTIRLIEAMKKIAEEAKPITGRGIGYKLFSQGLIGGMNEMNKVYRALKVAREDGDIPWEWIVDETRALEAVATWMNPRQCADGFFYRRDLWQTQPKTVELWAEKGTVRGVLWPVLAKLGVGFRVMHGFTSATSAWDVCNRGNDDRPLVALYVGDWDPSGLCMRQQSGGSISGSKSSIAGAFWPTRQFQSRNCAARSALATSAKSRAASAKPSARSLSR